MHLSIGYQLPDENDCISDIVQDFAGTVTNVYFAAPGQKSARMAIDPQDRDLMMEELGYIRDQGVTLTMLHNANCYGDLARSAELREILVKSTGEMIDKVGLTSVTTTSPFAAKVLKKEFPELRLCASVNMWIGTEQAMQALSSYFDDFYLQRELNRDFKAIERMKGWCDAHGKKLRLLANSGCLYTCPFHTFHDNLVAHDEGASGHENVMSSKPSPCWDYLEEIGVYKAAAAFLGESWIRPQDISKYEPYFDEVKLATRMHSNPRRVVSAYARGRFKGNMFDLTEPSFSRHFDKYILDATLFPEDWFERTSNCSRRCEECGYCFRTAEQMLITKQELAKLYQSS